MKWKQTTNEALGYTSWMLITRDMPGDPKPLCFTNETLHITADHMNFTTTFALNSIRRVEKRGEPPKPIVPWTGEPCRILPIGAFKALRDGGLPGLAAYRMVHGIEERFVDATMDSEGA